METIRTVSPFSAIWGGQAKDNTFVDFAYSFHALVTSGGGKYKVCLLIWVERAVNEPAGGGGRAATFDLLFNNNLWADWRSPSTRPKWAPKVMRPGPKKPAIAGPKIVIKNHTESS